MSYENDIINKVKNGEELPEKLDFSILRYFWQSNPFMSGTDNESIPRFLRKIEVLKNFSERELRILCNYLHHRKFSAGEKIFSQGDLGVGFYFMLSGYADIIVESNNLDKQIGHGSGPNIVITLEKFDYFGELALLQEVSRRNATAISRDGCDLLGIFKPDIEELIYSYPVIAAKLLQSVSLIVANRLFLLTSEVKELRYQLSSYERDGNGSI
jgi:CRP-like cAMP-binding protein